MGKPFDGMRGKSFNASKFSALLNLSVSRIAVLRNQRGARCNIAQSDVVHILKLGQHDRALLRVEQVVKEQNMLDVFVMMEGYCHLMAERINLIEHERECPEELKEAVASMLYASTRCGEFPELQEMRAIFTSRYGKEFVARATELRNNCGVNPKVIQKLSTRQPILENKLKVLKEIASENNIVLQFEEAASMTSEGKLEKEHKQQEGMEKMESFSDSVKAPRKYKDVADAAQAAFKSAANAAAAARAAVELSKSGPHDPNDQNGFVSGKRKATDEHEGTESKLQTAEENNSGRMDNPNVGMGFGKVNVIGNYCSESEDEEIRGKNRVEDERKSGMSGLSSDSDVSEGSRMPMEAVGEIRPVEDEYGESDRETGPEKGVLVSGNQEFGSEMKPPGSPMNEEVLVSKKSDTVMDEDNGAKLNQSEKKVRVGFRAGLKARLRAWQS
ncbi:hypothetical protein RHMOL_Rhmol09G0160500 [Rhododendron molle]|uniref:Uncharacterized protein n=1 Tax=Rhododendron molle TaxID=49168 RepID=A0ACC0MDX1_RHOML|nr:hypothetical protein RHMOL_Rhmol09G0160500 [Rhododendron molle]